MFIYCSLSVIPFGILVWFYTRTFERKFRYFVVKFCFYCFLLCLFFNLLIKHPQLTYLIVLVFFIVTLILIHTKAENNKYLHYKNVYNSSTCIFSSFRFNFFFIKVICTCMYIMFAPSNKSCIKQFFKWSFLIRNVIVSNSTKFFTKYDEKIVWFQFACNLFIFS